MSINVEQATDKLEVIGKYRAIINNPKANRNLNGYKAAEKAYDREYLELYKIYDRMTEEEKTEMEARLEQ